MIEMDVANSDEGYLKHPNVVEHSIRQYRVILFLKERHKWVMKWVGTAILRSIINYTSTAPSVLARPSLPI